MTPVPSQIFFVAGTENIQLEWTPVPGAITILELDGIQHGGTVTKATVNLGIGTPGVIWGLVNGQDSPAKAPRSPWNRFSHRQMH